MSPELFCHTQTMVETAFSEYGGEGEKKKHREKCSGCERPENVCLCPLLPSKSEGGLLQTNTHILILQHPHERKHKLATVPILQKCLLNCHVIVGRRLHTSCSPILANMTSESQVLLLYPGETAVDLDRWAATSSSVSTSATTETLDSQNEDKKGVSLDLDRRASTSSSSGVERSCLGTQKEKGKRVLLIVIDGTWQHAREMVRASMGFLREIGGWEVCLANDPNAEGANMWSCKQRLTLRKEPFGGCVSTMEAVARALRVLEPSPHAAQLEQKLLAVLAAMVAFQLNNLKPMKPRPKAVKEGQCHEA